MAKVNYNVGDTIQYRTLAGTIRTVVVEERDADIKRGCAGFVGECVAPDSALGGCWGYDHQVICVVKKAQDQCNSAGN